MCFVMYNLILNERQNEWEKNGRTLSYIDTIKLLPEIKKQSPFFKRVYSQVYYDVCMRIDLAYQAFFKGLASSPQRKKSPYEIRSFKYHQSGYKLIDDSTLYISKIGNIKIKMHRPLAGEPKSLAVCRGANGFWYAHFLCEISSSHKTPVDKIVGVDLGLTTFATLSDGKKIKRERFDKRDQKDIARLQRKLSTLEKYSWEYEKCCKAIGKAKSRAKRRRDNFLHQASNWLIENYQVIVFEDLDISKMGESGGKTIKKGISDVAWAKFINMCLYKAEERGRTVILVDPKHSSQMCSSCGIIVQKDITVRKHECPKCGLSMGRDLNAAINILQRGLDILPSSIFENVQIENKEQ